MNKNITDEIIHLANEIARTFLEFDLPEPAADALQKATSHWQANESSAISSPPIAPLRNHLDEFFHAQCQNKLSLLNTTMECWRHLPWRAGGGGKAPDIGVAELVGPNGVGTCDTCRAGVLFQSADYFYPWHQHAAEEFYLPINGAATWMAEGKESTVIAPMSQLIHHHSWQAHAIRTDTAPLLTLWLWTGDLSIERYTLCSPPHPKK